MDTQALKRNLIQWLSELKDEEVLKRVAQIKDNEDWWDSISTKEKEAIDEGLAQLDRGESFSHEEVMREAKEKYGL